MKQAIMNVWLGAMWTYTGTFYMMMGNRLLMWSGFLAGGLSLVAATLQIVTLSKGPKADKEDKDG